LLAAPRPARGLTESHPAKASSCAPRRRAGRRRARPPVPLWRGDPGVSHHQPLPGVEYFPSARQAALAWGRDPGVVQALCRRYEIPGAFRAEDGRYKISKGPEPPGLPRRDKLTKKEGREIARLARCSGLARFPKPGVGGSNPSRRTHRMSCKQRHSVAPASFRAYKRDCARVPSSNPTPTTLSTAVASSPASPRFRGREGPPPRAGAVRLTVRP
jgi:hypothetical protein